jgi:hypothetical protein
MSFTCNERDILHTQGTRLHTPRTIGVFDSSRIIEDILVEALYPNYGKNRLYLYTLGIPRALMVLY